MNRDEFVKKKNLKALEKINKRTCRSSNNAVISKLTKHVPCYNSINYIINRVVTRIFDFFQIFEIFDLLGKKIISNIWLFFQIIF